MTNLDQQTKDYKDSLVKIWFRTNSDKSYPNLPENEVVGEITEDAIKDVVPGTFAKMIGPIIIKRSWWEDKEYFATNIHRQIITDLCQSIADVVGANK